MPKNKDAVEKEFFPKNASGRHSFRNNMILHVKYECGNCGKYNDVYVPNIENILTICKYCKEYNRMKREDIVLLWEKYYF